MAAAIEYTMSVDEAKKPVILTGKDAVGSQLVQLLLLEPGTNPLFPNMGVGINNWMYSFAGDLNELKRTINSQISLFLPVYRGVPVQVYLDDNNNLKVDFEIDGTLYRYELTGENDDKTLSDFAGKV